MTASFVIAKLWPFLLISIVIIFFWLQRYFCANKIWFFQTSGSAVVFGVARFWYYVAPFFALAFVFYGISQVWSSDPHSRIATYWVFAGLGTIAVGLICGFLQPNWLSPPWLRRLKREHGDVINLLVEDAAGMDKYVLERRLETWEAIEQWVAEVRRKHGL